MELRERNPKPVRRTAVFFGETEFGEIEETGREGNSRFHACLRIGGTTHDCGLVQGHGATPDEAVRNAIMHSRFAAQKYLVGLLELEKAYLESV